MAKLLGVGLRPVHYPFLEHNTPNVVNWFEAISENYMDSLGRPREMLRKIRRKYPVGLHGVGMSLASPTGLNADYLRNLKALVDDIDPLLVSDHVCWTGPDQHNLHELLPFPYTSKNLKLVVDHLDQAQNAIGRQVLVENISAYFQFLENDYLEQEFLVEVARRAGTQILLDLNNAYVNSKNFSFSASDYISSIPAHLIGQIHLAGFSDLGDFLFDTHAKPVSGEVWQLFSELLPRIPNVPVAIEWDEHIPSFLELEDEVKRAQSIAGSYGPPTC